VGNQLITFSCGACRTPLHVRTHELMAYGGLAECPSCRTINQVQTPRHLTHNDPSVGMSIGMPGGPEFKSEVSRSDAGKMGFTILGAAIAVGAAILGIKLSNRS
jgi:hypothetical protein